MEAQTENADIADLQAIADRLPPELAGLPLSVEVTARDDAGRIEAVSITPMESRHD